MIRNEYGAVQQHLEPQHIRDILIPIPDDWNSVASIVEKTKKAVELKEQLEVASKEMDISIADLMKELMKEIKEE